jgi:threonylcarbamoyladenosine tRNA methylthiotransferase MtaB
MPEGTFHIINFGCRATQADGAAIEQAFSDRHLAKACAWQDSDVVVVNTCTVTQSADTQARQMIRRVHRENPDAKIIVTGCYAQRAPRELAQIEGVTCVVGNSHKEQLVPIVMEKYLSCASLPVLVSADDAATCSGPHLPLSLSELPGAVPGSGADVFCSSIFESRELRSIAEMSGGGRTRPVLKVQDGCSLRCSYCVIPYVRGDSRSLSEEEVLHQVTHLLNQGFKEIVFTGIHLGAYGRDLQRRSNLAGLIRKILKKKRLERLRLSSIEPLELTDEIIELVASSPKMAKHFHVPLQSGSDRVLRLMRRPYTADYYSRLVSRLRQYVPEAAIGADVMVGFPTEQDCDHEQTENLIRNAPMTYLHVFPYSGRPGTPSIHLKPEVPKEVAQRRSAVLRLLAAEKSLRFWTSFINRPLSVITLGEEENEVTCQAMSTNYIKVNLEKAVVRPNELLEVIVRRCTTDGVIGEVLPQPSKTTCATAY